LLKWIRWAWQCFGGGGYWLRARSGKAQRAETATGVAAAVAGDDAGSAPSPGDGSSAPR
jgi:hypothetical protein